MPIGSQYRVSPDETCPVLNWKIWRLSIDTVYSESVSPHAVLLNIYRMILALLNLQERAEEFPHIAQEAPLPTLTYDKKELQEIFRKIHINLLKSGWREVDRKRKWLDGISQTVHREQKSTWMSYQVHLKSDPIWRDYLMLIAKRRNYQQILGTRISTGEYSTSQEQCT